MKYELIGKNNYLEPIKTVLENRGIEDIQSFLSIKKDVVIHWSKLKNIERAIETFLEHVKKKSKFFIQVDADADGITSSAILINYLKMVFKGINIVWRMHEGKEHGVIVNTVPDDVDVVILPDAGSNQISEHKVLKEKGIDVIVLDHHECDSDSDCAIIVNSQISPKYLNKTLTGAGIVYKFIQGIDEKLGINKADNYLDLVSIGNIGDMADSRNLETRYYMLKGLEKLNNKMVKALFEKQSYSTKGNVNIVNVQFYIVPLINAAIRTGSKEEKEQMMRAFLETDEQIYDEEKDEYTDIYSDTARKLVNIRSRQNRLRDKGVLAIEERIKDRDLLKNKTLIVNVTDLLDKNLTGLVANQISKKYKRPIILIRQKNDSSIYGGSARGYEKGTIKDFKQFLTDTEKFIFCEGHSNAFGVEIEDEKLIEVNDLINEQLKDIEIDIDIHDVDFIVPVKQLNINFIKEIHKHRDLWGQNVEEPLVVIKDIEVNKDDLVIMGKNKNTLKFKYKGIEFIKFFSDIEEWRELRRKGERLVIDVIGKCSLNVWRGNETGQIIIEDYEVTEVKKKQFVF